MTREDVDAMMERHKNQCFAELGAMFLQAPRPWATVSAIGGMVVAIFGAVAIYYQAQASTTEELSVLGERVSNQKAMVDDIKHQLGYIQEIAKQQELIIKKLDELTDRR